MRAIRQQDGDRRRRQILWSGGDRVVALHSIVNVRGADIARPAALAGLDDRPAGLAGVLRRHLDRCLHMDADRVAIVADDAKRCQPGQHAVKRLLGHAAHQDNPCRYGFCNARTVFFRIGTENDQCAHFGNGKQVPPGNSRRTQKVHPVAPGLGLACLASRFFCVTGYEVFGHRRHFAGVVRCVIVHERCYTPRFHVCQ